MEYSKQLNESRIKVLAAREEAVQGLLSEAFAQLAALSKDQAAYKRLITDLRVGGCWGGVSGWVLGVLAVALLLVEPLPMPLPACRPGWTPCRLATQHSLFPPIELPLYRACTAGAAQA